MSQSPDPAQTQAQRSDGPLNAAVSKLANLSETVTGAVATLAVLGLLLGAMVVVVDVMLRWLTGGGVVALNEVMGQMFAMAVAATLPAGVARRVNLRVDLLAGHFGPRLSHILSVASSLSLALFFGALSYYVWLLAMRFLRQGRETLILEWPIAPTYIFASVVMGFALLAQIVLLLRDIAERPAPGAPRSSWIGIAMAAGLGAVVLAGGVLGCGLIWAVCRAR